MGDGPPRFRRGFTCPAVLRIRPGGAGILTTWLLHAMADLSRSIRLSSPFVTPMGRPTTPVCKHTGLGCFRFARRYSGNRICFLFLRVLRCFSSPGCLPSPMNSVVDSTRLRVEGFPIRKSPDRSLLTAPRGISVFVPSFFGS